MAQSKIISFHKPKPYLKYAAVLLLAVLAVKFIFKNAIPYFGFNQETFGRYWNFKWGLIGHISGGLIALIIGPFQFSKVIRDKYRPIHRLMGRIYLIAIVIATSCATYLAWTSGIQVNFAWAFGLQGLAFAWIVTASMAYLSVMRRRITQHKEWMIKSYVITFAFVTFRFLNDSAIAAKLMPKFEERGPTIIWFCWTIPLLVTQVVLSWQKKY